MSELSKLSEMQYFRCAILRHENELAPSDIVGKNSISAGAIFIINISTAGEALISIGLLLKLSVLFLQLRRKGTVTREHAYKAI